MAQKKQWFKLDNAAKIYPPARTRNWTAMFRISATLTEDIDVDILKKALERTLKRFPSFACRLRSGFFWYYLEHIDGIPPIEEDVHNPMAHLMMKENRHFLFRVRYYKNRLALEFFHALTDGTGALCFVLTLVREYLRLRYGVEIPSTPMVLDCDQAPSPEEYEDSFIKYAREETISRKEEPAYHVTGETLPLHDVMLISGIVPTDKLLAVSKSYGVSAGVLLTSLLLQAILEKQKEEKIKSKKRKPVKVSVPVNLRQFYPSKTVRNFASFINVPIDGRLGEYSFEEILTQVKAIMEQRLTEKQINARFSSNVKIERLLPARIVPLFIKKPVLQLSYRWQGDRYVSSSISNLGAMKLPAPMNQYVTRLDAFMGLSSAQQNKCACVSYNNKTVINFTRSIEEPDVERNFFTSMVKLGIPVLIESNGRNE